LRVLDLTTVLMGPYATQVLADMGADVIKVEPPEGDIVRQIGRARNKGMGGLFLNTNRGKRSIVLDLKSAAGREKAMAIAVTCDVLIYNVRPQAMARLGLSYADVTRARPDIVYVGVYGYGENGPYAGKPAYDDLMQGATGLASLFAQDAGGQPRYVPLALADRIVGLHAVNATLAALHHRSATGEGQKVDVPMFEAMVGMVMNDHLGGRTFDPPLDAGGYERLLAEHRRPYRTRDGFICTLIYNDKHWRAFYAALGRDISADPRLKDHSVRTTHIREIYAELAATFIEKTTEQWSELLTTADIPVMPLHTLDSLFDDPHLQATGFFEQAEHPSEGRVVSMKSPATFSGTPARAGRLAPRLGEHEEEILDEARRLARGAGTQQSNQP
jgi:crotonobetainyl-CoA:carnitine CoA-transferase CaiB-like acyl-CoA transferase